MTKRLKNDIVVQVQDETAKLAPNIDDWVGVHSLENILESFQPIELPLREVSKSACTVAKMWKKDSSSVRNNRMSIFFHSPNLTEIKALKHILYHIKMRHIKTNPKTRFKIILINAKDPLQLQLSFEKLSKAYFPKMKLKVDQDNFHTFIFDQKMVDDIYNEINSENSPKNQSLFLFSGSTSLDQIQKFLPRQNQALPFSQFLVATSSKTTSWNMAELKLGLELELELEKWEIKKFLGFDEELIEFTWQGVHASSELPASFAPSRDFTSRDKIIDQLVERFENIPPLKAGTLQHKNGCTCRLEQQRQRQNSISLPPPPPPALFTLITGISGIGKTELIKKFLSTHHNLFSKLVLTDAIYPMGSLKNFASCFGIYSLSEIEGTTEDEKIVVLHSKLTDQTDQFQLRKRVLFVFDDAWSLEKIKDYLPKNKCENLINDVIVTSRNRDWKKEEDVKFYKANGYDFQEISLLEGFSLEETHQFCSKILPRHGILYLKEDLNRSIRELHKLTGGFPPILQLVISFISESSRSNPEWSPNIHILNYISWHILHFSEIGDYCFGHAFSEIRMSPDRLAAVGKKILLESRNLFLIMCLMDPQHLDYDMICYFYLEQDKPFKPPGAPIERPDEPEQVEQVNHLLSILEHDSFIKIERKGGKVKTVRIPESLADNLRRWAVYSFVSRRMRSRLSGKRETVKEPFPSCTWTLTRPLDVPRLWPHILSINGNYTRDPGYTNQYLIECIQNHLDFWKNLPQEHQVPGETPGRPGADYKTERDKVAKLVEKEDPDFKGAFGDFSKVDNPAIYLPLIYFLLLLLDIATDLNSVRIMLKAGYISYFCLSLFLVVLPFTLLCKLHYCDRTEYNFELKNRDHESWRDYLSAFFGTIDSHRLQLQFIRRFQKAKDNLERGLLFERLCTLRANAEYQSMAEALMESLPQLLLQFPLYLLSYTEEYSDLRHIMQDSFLPYELSLGISFFSFGLTLTKLESLYFGWNMELKGIKLLGYRIIHLLINAAHIATLVLCSGIVSVIFPPFIFVISLFFCLSATAWIFSNTKEDYEFKLWKYFLASFYPAYVKKGRTTETKLEFASKHEFVGARLGHDLLFFRRRPKKSDIVYLFVFFSSVLISAFASIYCTFNDLSCQGKESPVTMDNNISGSISSPIWGISVIRQCAFPFILWLPLLFMWQVLRQILNNVYLKYSKVPPITEEYILEDPEGILRYPANTQRWIRKRLYCQIRRNEPNVFSQTWTQVKETFTKFNKQNFPTKFTIFIKLMFKLLGGFLYFSFIIALLCLVPYNTTLSRMYSPTLFTSSNFNNTHS